MAQFTTAQLTNERVLVKGTDQFGTTGETVVSSSEWNDVKTHLAHHDAVDGFNDAVEQFFGPLLEATALLDQSVQAPKPDPISYVVIHEGTEEVEGQDEIAVKLGSDSIVLRLLEQGDHDRLVWVNGSLEVLQVLDFDEDLVANQQADPVVTDYEDDQPFEG